MTLLAIDPGLITGWFYYHEDTHQWESGQSTFEDMAMRLENMAHGCSTFVVEKYTITTETAKKSRQHDALEVTGMVRYFAWAEHATFVNDITPSVSMNLASDDRLKDIGWYTRGKIHANDAARQMFTHFIRKGYITFDEDLHPINRLATTASEGPGIYG